MNPPKMTPAMRRKVSLGVKRANARRRSPVRRFARRVGGGFNAGSLGGAFKSALSSGMLMKAGGAVGATLGVGFVLNKWGSSLPLANNQYGRVLYTLGIPVAAGYLLRRKSPALAEGIILGGLIMSVNTLVQGFRSQTTPAPATTAAVGSFAVAGELGRGTFSRHGHTTGGHAGRFSYYPQGSMDRTALGGANVAFPDSAWG